MSRQAQRQALEARAALEAHRLTFLHLAWGRQALCGAVGPTRVTGAAQDVDCPDCQAREPFRRELKNGWTLPEWIEANR
jgi:hypothetical protein